MGGGLCKAKTRKTAGAAKEEVIQSANERGGEFLARKLIENLALEANANESLHGGGHYQHVGYAIVECVEHVVDRIDINHIGLGCERASIERHRCRRKCLLLRVQASA